MRATTPEGRSCAPGERPAEAARVGVAATDVVRRMSLASLAAAAGATVVEAGEPYDLLLTDRPDLALAASRAVLFGGDDAPVAGVLPAEASPAQLAAALDAIGVGLTVRGPRTMPTAPVENGLTPRERDVLEAVGNGLSNKAIARALAISPHTVKFHLEAVFRKLGVSSRAEAVRRGLPR